MELHGSALGQSRSGAARGRERPKWRVIIALTVSLLLGFTAATVVPQAVATSSVSGYGHFSHGGDDFRNQAVVNTASGQPWANTWTWPQGHTQPAGWLGSRGRLFRATNNPPLYCEGTTVYNASSLPSGHPVVGQSCRRTVNGQWISYGVSRAYNGVTWKNVFTFQSGIVTTP